VTPAATGLLALVALVALVAGTGTGADSATSAASSAANRCSISRARGRRVRREIMDVPRDAIAFPICSSVQPDADLILLMRSW